MMIPINYIFSSEIETTHQASPIVSIKEVCGNSNWSVCGWFLFHWDSLIRRKAKEWRCRLVWWDSKSNLLTCLKQLTTVLKNPYQPVNLQKMFCNIFNLPTWDMTLIEIVVSCSISVCKSMNHLNVFCVWSHQLQELSDSHHRSPLVGSDGNSPASFRDWFCFC